jgi:dTDP-4-dehydrorhamnose reductase
MMVSLAERFDAHLLFASTDLVFEGASECPSGGFDEYATPSPLSVYARTKRLAEQEVVGYPLGAVVRLSLVYGHTLSTSRGALGWIEDGLRTQTPLVLFCDEYRTPLYVEDAARAILGISMRQLTGTWHCGGPERLSRVTFGRLVADVGGFSSDGIVERTRAEVSSQPPRPEDVSLNSARLFNTLAFQPHTVRSGLLQVYHARAPEPG